MTPRCACTACQRAGPPTPREDGRFDRFGAEPRPSLPEGFTAPLESDLVAFCRCGYPDPSIHLPACPLWRPRRDRPASVMAGTYADDRVHSTGPRVITPGEMS